MPEGIVKYGLRRRRRCCNAGLAGDVVVAGRRIRFFSIDRSDRFAEGTDLKTRRRHGRRGDDGYRVPWRGTKFEISSGGLPRAANFSFNSLPHKESRLPDPKGEKSRKRLESRCRAGQSSRRIPSGASGSPVPSSRLPKSQGASTDFYTRWTMFIESYFSIGWTFRMFIIHARCILLRGSKRISYRRN